MPLGESNTGCVQTEVRERPIPIMEKSSLSRQRYVELCQLGLRASEELIKHGLQRSEYCEFGQIMQKIMQLG